MSQNPDVVDYLSMSFTDPVMLLRGMSKSMAFLSGQMCEEFFVHGSSDSSSTWRFYVKARADLVNTFMEHSESAGVRWLSPNEHVNRIMAAVHGRGMFTSASLGNVMPEVKEILSSTDERCWIKVSNETGCIVPKHVSSPDLPPGMSHVVYGEVGSQGSKRMVELVVIRQCNPMMGNYLFDFANTNEQCFINAHVAAHLYGKTSVAKKFHAFVKPYASMYGVRGERPGAKGSILYQRTRPSVPDERGFKIRMGGDDECTDVRVRNVSDAPESVLEMYEQCYYNMVWSESKWVSSIKDSKKMYYFEQRQMSPPQKECGFGLFGRSEWVTNSSVQNAALNNLEDVYRMDGLWCDHDAMFSYEVNDSWMSLSGKEDLYKVEYRE